MMNKKIFSFGLAFLLIFTAGCDMIQVDLGGEDQGIKLQNGNISIVSPADGTHISVNQTVDITSDVSIAAYAFGVHLIVNGQPYYFTHFYQNMRVFSIYQPWTPAAPGEYLIQTKLEEGTGGQSESNIITILVDGIEESPQQETEKEVDDASDQQEEECIDPIATTHSYANCRSGPGTGYEIVEGLRLDQSFPIVGRSASGIWFQVERNSSGATCWIWEDLVDICGNTDDVEVSGMQEKDEVIEEEIPEDQPEEQPLPLPPATYSACHDYPDFGMCTSDPMDFGGCSWDTGQSQCVP